MIKSKKFILSCLTCFIFVLSCLLGVMVFNSSLTAYAAEQHGFIVTKSNGSEAVGVDWDGQGQAPSGVDYFWDDSSFLCVISNDLVISGQGLESEGIMIGYGENNPTAVTFNNLKSQKEIHVYSKNDITITLKGENQIGNNTSDKPMVGISFFYSALTITGDGNLTIYDKSEGILAGSLNEYKNLNLKIDEAFTGKITIWDEGFVEEADPQPPCAISIGTGTLTIKNGTLVLVSETNNAITAGSILIDENLVVYSGDSADELEKGTYTAGKHIAYITNSSLIDIVGEGQQEFMPWVCNNTLPTVAGNWYLATDVTLSETWEAPTGETKLCLNGHVIDVNGFYYEEGNDEVTQNNDASLKVSTGAHLILCDSDNSVEHKFSKIDGLGYDGNEFLYLWNDELTDQETDYIVTGGLITRACCDAILIEGGAFTMNGGTIIGNDSIGVYSDSGRFVMNGGEIANCLEFGANIYYSVCTINGGSINNNLGCGIYIEGSTFVMNGGDIFNNAGFGGISFQGSDVTINSGTIRNNTAYMMSSGISCLGGTLTLNGGTICDNVALTEDESFESAGGGVFVYFGIFNMNGGKITRNTAHSGGGVFVCEGSIFNMYGGEISENISETSGGGVAIRDIELGPMQIFNMHAGAIINNVAGTCGGGVALAYGSCFKADGGTISGNKARVDGAGVYVEYDGDSRVETCLAKGTPIVVADGQNYITKNIEDLNPDDQLIVFDHTTGELVKADIFDWWFFPMYKTGAFTLHFTNNIDVTVVGGHCFFEKTANKYINIDANNVNDFIDKEFYNALNNRWETLSSVTFIDEAVETYILVSKTYLNTLANGMLSNVDGLYTVLCNIFDFDEDLKYKSVDEDIANYPIWPYDEEHFHYVSEDTYEALNLKYLSIAIGKGLLTYDELRTAAENTLRYNPEIIKEEAFLNSGICLGGTIQITGNMVEKLEGDNVISTFENNLQMWQDDMKIKIGTGIIGNGVKAPEAGMSVGITFIDYDYNSVEGAVTINGVGNYAQYFFADNEKYGIKYNNNGTVDDVSDDYIEHVALLIISNNSSESVKSVNNGYIKLDNVGAFEGETVIVNVFANKGYKLARLIYNDGINDVEIPCVNGVYSFVMPSGAITIMAEFEKINNSFVLVWVIGGIILLLLLIYLLGYFFLYRKGKLDDKKIKVIYKILPRGKNNLEEEKQEVKPQENKQNINKKTTKKSPKNK